MNTFFSADFHFSHKNIIFYCQERLRFLNPEEVAAYHLSKDNNLDVRKVNVSWDSVKRMNDAIIDNINVVVQKNDNLRILGDFCFVRKDKNKANYFRDRINCLNVDFITGNHDRKDIIGSLFDSYEKIEEISIFGQKIVMCHFPMLSWNQKERGSWMLHGHCHNNMDNWKNEHMPKAKILDVGVDGHNFKPWSFEEIKEYMKKKEEN